MIVDKQLSLFFTAILTCCSVDTITRERKTQKWVRTPLAIFSLWTSASNSTSLASFYVTGKCMSRLNVSAMDTRDAKGRGRFFPFFPEQHIFPGKVTKDYWYWQSIYYPAKEVILFLKTIAIKTCPYQSMSTGAGMLFGQRNLFSLRQT